MTPDDFPEFDYVTTSELCTRAGQLDAERWLWEGYLAGGTVTLLVGRWKAGKTTLLSVLLARLGAGGTLAGLAVRPGRAVVVTEEQDHLWQERIQRLGIGPHVTVLSRPFRGRRPTPERWHRLVDSLVARREAGELDLAVIDPLADFLPSRTENNAGVMLDMLLPFQALTQRGAGVMILHHPSKGPTVAGQASRGSGALPGSVDILLEMEQLKGVLPDDRRRRLSAFSRHHSTPRRLVIELTPDGKDYVSLGDDLGHEFEDNWKVLAGVLEDATRKLTRADILAQWPADFFKPSAVELWRWLDRAVKDGRLLMEGTGRRNHPFKYWLDGMEEVWKSDPTRVFLDSLAPLPELEPLVPERRKTLAEVKAERAGKGRP